jgi:hypothetical protein
MVDMAAAALGGFVVMGVEKQTVADGGAAELKRVNWALYMVKLAPMLREKAGGMLDASFSLWIGSLS